MTRHGVTPFTAVATCPECGKADYHRFREPRKRPAHIDPTETLVKRRGDKEIHVWGGVGTLFDPDQAEAIRQCACGAEWPQA